jgi:uncharacterized protein YkwD
MTYPPVPARVSEEDRSRWERQVGALRREESDDEGTPEWRAQLVTETNRLRSRRGTPELKTETEMHRYARALGLIRH